MIRSATNGLSAGLDDAAVWSSARGWLSRRVRTAVPVADVACVWARSADGPEGLETWLVFEDRGGRRLVVSAQAEGFDRLCAALQGRFPGLVFEPASPSRPGEILLWSARSLVAA